MTARRGKVDEPTARTAVDFQMVLLRRAGEPQQTASPFINRYYYLLIAVNYSLLSLPT